MYEMNKFGFATVAASAFAAAFIGLAGPAQAAPTGPGTAEQTISDLRDEGYRVVVNRINDVPLAKARVVSVSPNVSTRPRLVKSDDEPTGSYFGRVITVTVQ